MAGGESVLLYMYLISTNRLAQFCFCHFVLGLTFPLTTLILSGLWFDLEISYSGSFLMTLETKMNLSRLGKEGEGLRLGEFGKEG